MVNYNYIYTSLKNEHTFHIILNRQKQYNSLNQKLSQELISAFKYADENTKIKCIIISGGDNFSAGADISELYTDPHFIDLWEEIDKIKKPIIAIINGVALGGGLELILMFDIILATKDSKFGQPEIKLGLIPGGGATQRLPRIIGKNLSLEMCLTGNTISAIEAKELGIINKICSEEELIQFAENLASHIAEKSTESIIMIKHLIKQSFNLKIEEGLRQEKNNFYKIIKSKNGIEGINAFIEKRKPKFCD